jgi:aldose sugar dehydrogenase
MTFRVFYILCIIIYLQTACVKKEVRHEEHTSSTLPIKLEVKAKNLEIPWGMAFLPNGDLLFCERNGRISLLKTNGDLTVLLTRAVNATGEAGLLGLAIDPAYSGNHYVYVYESTDSNRVARLIFNNGVLSDDRIIVTGIPRSLNHDGGALAFGPDGYLYIGTGDAQKPMLAQDKNSQAGKILRVDRDGKPAAGNPFGNRVWSYGHRNVQGFCWTSSGTMFATEHGPSGEFGWCCHDELNIIKPGKNYGWPLVFAGNETDSLTAPAAHSGNDTWAPSGCLWLGASSLWPNTVVAGCLRGQKLIRFQLSDAGPSVLSVSDTLSGILKRLRNVAEAPDHSLCFTSSNRGSVSDPPEGDDKIYRLGR